MSLHYLLANLRRPKKLPETKPEPQLASKPKGEKSNGKPRPSPFEASGSRSQPDWKN